MSGRRYDTQRRSRRLGRVRACGSSQQRSEFQPHRPDATDKAQVTAGHKKRFGRPAISLWLTTWRGWAWRQRPLHRQPAPRKEKYYFRTARRSLADCRAEETRRHNTLQTEPLHELAREFQTYQEDRTDRAIIAIQNLVTKTTQQLGTKPMAFQQISRASEEGFPNAHPRARTLECESGLGDITLLAI